ncbi:amidohydrolase family protein [Zunongwangia sp. HGR-M22]|uniref:amidohydrolase family protein n=1 Tax=Zunongwangia sp. HGR-M22 TaxID=3015168 RepID=UPI0022DDE240|nr:amidohydrolase family protein [Zunongwangia sp. HGR-M22]WBL24684.1 amidohydrolase family protein [Zunongwangia sp. HGR-M22]
MKIIDTHIHIWDFEKAKYTWLEGNNSPLNRTYAIEELEGERLKTNVEYGILVQAANNFEDTDWMLNVANRTSWIKGVVGWLPLLDPEYSKAILQNKYQKNLYFKGVRHLIHDEKDARWLLQPKVLKSLQVLAKHQIPFDVVGVLPEHIETALEVCRQVPELKMVFDHLNQPPIKENLKFGSWGDLMKKAAQNQNFYMKISGLGTTSGKPEKWRKDDISDYIKFILDHFGSYRCFLGGDWPVSLLSGSYSYTWRQYEETLQDLLSEEERRAVYYDNANTFYNLNLEDL